MVMVYNFYVYEERGWIYIENVLFNLEKGMSKFKIVEKMSVEILVVFVDEISIIEIKFGVFYWFFGKDNLGKKIIKGFNWWKGIFILKFRVWIDNVDE